MSGSRSRAYIYLVITAIIWGVAAIVIKLTLVSFSPLVFLTYRFAISAAFALLALPIIKIHLPKDRNTLLLSLLYCFLVTTVSLGLLFFGFDKTTAISASLIGSVAPILTAIAGYFFLREHITIRERIGMGIALIGTVVMIIEPLLENHDGLSGLSGNILILASLLVGTCVAILAKLIMRKETSPVGLTNLSYIVGFITTIPIVLIGTSPSELINTITSAPLTAHLGVLYMAILSGNVAYILWLKAQKTIEIGEAGLFAYIPPIISIPMAAIFLHEHISMAFIVGAVVIALGVILAEVKVRRS